MNAEQIAKALRSCARNCDGSHSCWHSAILKDAAALIESLQSQLAESRRRADEAVAILRTIDWVGSGAKGRIEDAIGILTGRGPSDKEVHHDA